jgi:hypothetical protein
LILRSSGYHLPNTNDLGGIIMKKMVAMAIMFFLFSMNIYAEDDFFIKESNLLERGYTKTTPRDYFYMRIIEDCYEKIFNKSHMIEQPGERVISDCDIGDGFIYRLVYLLGEEGLPNILVMVLLKNDGEIYTYYKMNLALEGVIMLTNYGELLVFL